MTILRRVTLLVSAVVLLVGVADRCAADSCPGMCEPQGSPIWESDIILGTPAPFSITLSWTPCSAQICGMDPMYIVQYRQKGSSAMYDTITHINGTNAEITGLQSQTQYEIRVCLQQNSTNCGACVRCFETMPADEPPSTPRNVMAEGTSPQSITVTFLPPLIWNSLTDISYNLTYQPVMNENVSFILFGSNVAHNVEGMEERLIEGLKEDTEYIIRVSAINSFGASHLSMAISASTKAFMSDPGALLLANGTEIMYYQVNDVTVADSDLIPDNANPLYTFPAIVRGITYHLYQPNVTNQSEIYVSLESGEIRKITVVVNKDVDTVDLTVMGNDSLVYNVSGGYNLGRVSIDWVYNILYWVEFQGGDSRIRRLGLDGGSPEQVGMVQSGEIRDIFPDPLYGYFYWLVIDSHLSRVPLSAVMSANSTSPDPFSLSSIEVLYMYNNTGDGFITSFSIDLVDINIFYLRHESVFLLSLSGTELREFQLGSGNIPLPLVASYQDYAFSYLENLLILTQMVLPIADTTTNQDLSEFTNVKFTPTANSMFRGSLQPLPVPPSVPDQIRVTPDTDSVMVTWTAPQFFGSIHGESAFSAWEYEIIYGPINENASLISTGRTTSLSQFIQDLMPNTTYRLQLKVSGPGETIATDFLAFTTMHVTNETLKLLVAADTGLFQTGLDGSAMFIQRGSSDRSNGTVRDSITGTYFWVVDNTALGNLYGSDTIEDTPLMPMLVERDNPFALSLDWIGRSLYWVEGDSNKLVTVPLSNITNEAVRLFASEDFITDIAVDSLNGLVFWTSETEIKARTINGLFMPKCVDVTGLRALAIDPSRRRLYYLVVAETSMVTLGQVEYMYEPMEGCCCRVEHVLSKLSLQPSLTVSMVYAAGMLFIAQYSSTVIYFVTADLAAINASTTTLAVGEVSPTLDAFIPGQFRDLSVILDESQLLPVGLSPMDIGDVAPEIPLPLPEPRDNGSTSTVLRVSWEPIDLVFTSIFYVLQYNLSKPNGTTVSGEITTNETMLMLPDQLFYTRVDLELRAYSLWQEANGTSTASFILPPQIPEKVQNVRVNVYFPHRNSPTVSAQVIWDGLSNLEAGGIVDNYIITVRDSNGTLITAGNIIGEPDAWVGPPFEVDGDRTEFTLAIFGMQNFLFYPLIINRMYSLDVFARNSAGDGEKSDVVMFDTKGSTPPLEVLQIGSGGGKVVRNGTSSNSSPIRLPAAIDSVNRFIYYIGEDGFLSQISLDDNAESQSISALPLGLSPTALAYDWLGEAVYIAGRSNEGRFVVWKLSDSVSAAFPAAEIYRGDLSISETSTTSLVMNPFTGFLHWTLGNTSSYTLFQLDLRDNTSLLPVLQSSRRRRDTACSLVPTSALTEDPENNRIWLSDQSTGNIVSYTTNNLVDCRVEVDASGLGNQLAGLPADSLALDELRIYWTNNDNASIVFYVPRNDSSPTLGILTSSMTGSAIFTLSPGQQPLPEAKENIYKQVRQTCLTPVYEPEEPNAISGVVLHVESITNNSIFLTWDPPTLPEDCVGKVFSYPPLVYMIEVRISQSDHPDLPVVTINEPFYLVTGLEPFTLYDIQAAGVNQYTVEDVDSFGPEIEVYTLEGVPQQVEPYAVAYSPRHIYIFWDELDERALRGNVSNQEFIIHVLESTMRERCKCNGTMVDGLDRGTEFTFTVQVSNGELTSEPAFATSTTLPRPPFPKEQDVGNTSLLCEVDFGDDGHMQIMEVMVNISSEDDTRELESMSLPFDGNRSYNFTFDNLRAFTNYSLVTVVLYGEVVADNGVTLGPEMDYSEPYFILTDEGVPGAPVASINGDTLSWEKPRANGRDIMTYLVSIREKTGKAINITEGDTSLNLRDYVEENGDYNITVTAINIIGKGPASNSVEYEVDNDPFKIVGGLLGLIAICVGGFIVLFVFCISFCIPGYCCLVSYRSKTVTIGGDYELNRLRALAAHSHSSANPHYMWSRDDYKCTDEDMEQLTKFPRSKLHLETFIDRGEFGEVYQGSAHDILGPGTGPTPVAVKTLRKAATPDEHMKFLSEAHLMSQFNHQNIVKVLGVCIDNDPIYIIMELMPAGDLLKFLREAKRDHGPALLTLPELIQVALDVAHGCRYLEQQHFIHRDIAARNCLVSSKGADRVVKIGDFGLAKDLYSSDYYQVEGQRKLPVRWMAPEALLQGKFVIESDIWSYGVLLWEIMTLGNQPYPGRTNQEVLQFVTGGGRLDRPENCPSRIYKLMMYCWKKYGSERIHFAQIVEFLEHFLENVHNTNRDSYYSDDDSDTEPGFERQPSRSSRTPSLRSGLMSIARQGSRLRNSFRRRSLHRKDFENPSQNSEEQFIGEGNQYYRERGPF